MVAMTTGCRAIDDAVIHIGGGAKLRIAPHRGCPSGSAGICKHSYICQRNGSVVAAADSAAKPGRVFRKGAVDDRRCPIRLPKSAPGIGRRVAPEVAAFNRGGSKAVDCATVVGSALRKCAATNLERTAVADTDVTTTTPKPGHPRSPRYSQVDDFSIAICRYPKGPDIAAYGYEISPAFNPQR